MPRKYNRKKSLPPYSPSDVQNAVQEIQNGITYRALEKKYKIPRCVLNRYVRAQDPKLGTGARSVLSKKEEDVLQECHIARSIMGYPCDRGELLRLVQEYVKINKMKTPFNNGLPGKEWYYGYMRRHPKLSLKKPEYLQKARVSSRDPFVIYNFFDMVEDVYKQCNVSSRSAPLIFNTDESGFGSDPTKVKGIGEAGVALTRVNDGAGKDSTTVLACVSADGERLPPLIVFKGQAVQPGWVTPEEYPGTMYAANTNGWMEESTFYQWLTKMFIPHVENVRISKGLDGETAILFFDGHASHISMRIIDLAIENNIKLIKFPSHLTDLLQPLDVCVFKPVKSKWYDMLVAHGISRMGRGEIKVQKPEFGALLKEVWQLITSKNVTSGFNCTGLFPFNKEMIKESWFQGDALKRYKKHVQAKAYMEIGGGDSQIIQSPFMTIPQSNELAISQPPLTDPPQPDAYGFVFT